MTLLQQLHPRDKRLSHDVNSRPYIDQGPS